MNARIGYVSKGIYSTYKNHHEYTVWKNMLNRVYNPKSSRDMRTYPTVADAQRAYWSEKFRVIQETTIRYWQYLPEPLAWRLLTFDWPDAHAYYGDDAAIRL